MTNNIPTSERQSSRKAVKESRLRWHQMVEQHRAGDDRVDADVMLLTLINYVHDVNEATGQLRDMLGGLVSHEISSPQTRMDRLLKFGKRADNIAVAELGLPQTITFPGEK